MNNIKMKSIYFFLVATFFTAGVKAQSVAINTDGSVANPSAILDLKSTTNGFLPPRMTQAQRNVISTPAAGLMVYCTDCGSGEPQFYNGASWVNMVGGATTAAIPSVTSTTGKIWMDRNLGATQVATSSTDAASYGHLYQWGRLTDGHQIRTSVTTTTLSSGNVPGNANFITMANSPYDWRSPQNNSLWQGVNGTNNPCPTGYRLPTATELDNERAKFPSQNAAGAFASVLKLPMAGYRNSSGSFVGVGTGSNYWSSTIDGTNATQLGYGSTSASLNPLNRVFGMSVRCLKD